MLAVFVPETVLRRTVHGRTVHAHVDGLHVLDHGADGTPLLCHFLATFW